MSYENVPCASPDETDGQEEPAPSLYGVDSHEDKIRSVKQPLSAPSRLAETANIEDHVIMNEEEIAQVRDSMQRRDIFSQSRSSSNERKADETMKHLDERKTPGTYHKWIDLNLPKNSHLYAGSEPRTNNAEVPMNEFAERGASVIKRTVKEIVSPDNENRNIRKVGKDEYLKLDPSVHSIDRTRAYYYRHPHEDMKTPVIVRDNSKDEYDSDNEKHPKSQGHRAVPQVFYMHHPNSVAISQAGKLGAQSPLGVLPNHAHLIRNRFADNRPIHGQRTEYASNRPEQQVPVANSSADSAEHSRYGGIPAHTGIQYVDRQGYVQQGFALLPGIGPVRVVDGMYYSGIPMGRDSSHYENFGAVPTFVPNIQGDAAVLHPQRQPKVTNTPTSETPASQSQDKSQSK